MIPRLRVPLGFAVAAAVFYFANPDGMSILLGLPFALLGLLFRFLAAGTIQKDSQLATSGPYSLTRNPLYFGSTLLAMGFAIMSASMIAAALLLIPSAIIYPIVIQNEERHLQRLFRDQFEHYCTKVPRFFPRLSLAFRLSFCFKQYVNNREYNTALGFLGALGVLVVKSLA